MHRFGAGPRCAGWSQSSPTDSVSLDNYTTGGPHERRPTSMVTHRTTGTDWDSNEQVVLSPEESTTVRSSFLIHQKTRITTTTDLSGLQETQEFIHYKGDCPGQSAQVFWHGQKTHDNYGLLRTTQDLKRLESQECIHITTVTDKTRMDLSLGAKD